MVADDTQSMAQVSIYFIRSQDVSDAVAGAYLVPSSLGFAVGALIGGYVINRYRAMECMTRL